MKWLADRVPSFVDTIAKICIVVALVSVATLFAVEAISKVFELINK